MLGEEVLQGLEQELLHGNDETQTVEYWERYLEEHESDDDE